MLNNEHENNVVEMICDVTYTGAKYGTAGYAGTAAGLATTEAAGAVITATGIGAGLASGGIAATTLAFAPPVVGFGAACAVGNLVCDIFDSIFD